MYSNPPNLPPPQSDFISMRHHTYAMPRGVKSVELKECGPRFEMKLYQIKLGTLDQSHAENEFVLRSHVRSAKKSKLGDAAAPDEGHGGDAAQRKTAAAMRHR